jgi:hypothetical protein
VFGSQIYTISFLVICILKEKILPWPLLGSRWNNNRLSEPYAKPLHNASTQIILKRIRDARCNKSYFSAFAKIIDVNNNYKINKNRFTFFRSI